MRVRASTFLNSSHSQFLCSPSLPQPIRAILAPSRMIESSSAMAHNIFPTNQANRSAIETGWLRPGGSTSKLRALPDLSSSTESQSRSRAQNSQVEQEANRLNVRRTHMSNNPSGAERGRRAVEDMTSVRTPIVVDKARDVPLFSCDCNSERPLKRIAIGSPPSLELWGFSLLLLSPQDLRTRSSTSSLSIRPVDCARTCSSRATRASGFLFSSAVGRDEE